MIVASEPAFTTGAVLEDAKLAVIVPVPPMVAVVDEDPELAKVMDPVLLDHEENV